MRNGQGVTHRVLVAHPERQHSHEFALALHSHDGLERYIHGSPLRAGVLRALPRSLRWQLPICPVWRKLVAPIIPARARRRAYSQMMRMFDAIVASRLPRIRIDAVVAYEGSALHTFLAARRLGIACILDAANLHHSFQDKWVAGANTASDIAEKDREIELADLVITCSSLARDSYIDAGLPEDKVRAVRLGVDLSLFRHLRAASGVPAYRTGPVVFCNAGLLDRRKGMDLIASACRSLVTAGHSFQFVLAGSTTGVEPSLLQDLAQLTLIRRRMPQENIPAFYSEADVFVLPSRCDSFGMVVPEALACGLPVIVSDNVGARDMVQEGVNGWVVPAGSVRALADRMEWCAKNPQAVRAMARAARVSAEARGWTQYRDEVAEVVGRAIESRTSLY